MRAFTAVEISPDQPFFICTRLQLVEQTWQRTTALLMFEEDLREILNDDDENFCLVDLLMVEPKKKGWKTRNIGRLWDEFSNELQKKILIFFDEDDCVSTFESVETLPKLTTRPTWSKEH